MARTGPDAGAAGRAVRAFWKSLSCARYTERDYAGLADACHAIAQILRQRGERRTDLDEDACELCDEPLDMLTCSQCGVDAFVRTCEHGDPRPIRVVEGALYCRTCRA